MFRCPRTIFIYINSCPLLVTVYSRPGPLLTPNQGKSIVSIDIIHHIPCNVTFHNYILYLFIRDLNYICHHFTFMLPCIVIDFFLNKQQDALITEINSVIKLYMFRASFLPIIRSFLLYIRHW